MMSFQRVVHLILFFSLLSCAMKEVAEKEEISLEPQAEVEDKDVDSEYVEATPEDIGEIDVTPEASAKEKEADQMSLTTFPLVYNEMVQAWIDYFTGRGRSTFEKYLIRSTRYIPLMKQILKEEGVPEDLIYLSMIESGFNPKAYSRARAVGPWQFMEGTGKRYGLMVNFWIDERKDIVKSTHAAAQYLKELHAIFGSWYLAAAGYNAGEGRVLSAIRREKNRNFWELVHGKKNFRAETKNYVPKMIAAALISKNPQKYGFSENLPYEQPLAWDSLTIPGGIDLRAVAQVIGVDMEILQLINAELRTGITPPDSKEGYEVRIPPEKKELLASKLGELSRIQVASFINHKVNRGENLGYIARRYKTSVNLLLKLNNISNPRALRIGMILKVPLPKAASVRGTYLPLEKNEKRRESAKARKIVSMKFASHPAQKRKSASGATKKVSKATVAAKKIARTASRKSTRQAHRVKKGDTLTAIAKRYGVKMDEILKHNKMRDKGVRVGQVLNIP